MDNSQLNGKIENVPNHQPETHDEVEDAAASAQAARPGGEV